LICSFGRPYVEVRRRFELWGEGFRGRDIKRLKLALDRTGSNHNPWNYQIPQGEIDANNNISEADQNE
jgi:hypothetical protein